MKVGLAQLVVALIVVIVLFGPTQIPKLAKLFGQGVKGLRDGLRNMDNEGETDGE